MAKTIDENVQDAIAQVALDMVSRVDRLKKYAAALKLLFDGGLEVRTDRYALMYRSYIPVSRNQLPMLRKIVGRFDSKRSFRSLGEVVDGVQMVNVRIYAKDKRFDEIGFEYPTPYRAGGRCEIKVMPESSYKTLVCKV